MAKKKSPKWVKDSNEVYCVEFHGAYWYPDLYGFGLSMIFKKNKGFKVLDLVSADADKATVKEFIQKHPNPAAA